MVIMAGPQDNQKQRWEDKQDQGKDHFNCGLCRHLLYFLDALGSQRVGVQFVMFFAMLVPNCSD